MLLTPPDTPLSYLATRKVKVITTTEHTYAVGSETGRCHVHHQADKHAADEDAAAHPNMRPPEACVKKGAWVSHW